MKSPYQLLAGKAGLWGEIPYAVLAAAVCSSSIAARLCRMWRSCALDPVCFQFLVLHKPPPPLLHIHIPRSLELELVGVHAALESELGGEVALEGLCKAARRRAHQTHLVYPATTLIPPKGMQEREAEDAQDLMRDPVPSGNPARWGIDQKGQDRFCI